MVAVGISAFGLCSCSEDDGPNAGSVTGANAIRFTAAAQLSSRTGDVTTNNLKEFNVYAYTGTATNPELFMDNVVVSKGENNTWSYSPVKYWPVGETVDFYAFAPGTWVGSDGPLKPVEYDNGYGNTAGTQDIIYAVSPDLSGYTDAPNAQVVFNFRHALSKVSVKMSSTNANLRVEVKNVVLGNIMSRGNFNFPRVSTSQSISPSTPATGAVAEESIGKWTDLNTPSNYILYQAQSADDIIVLTTTPKLVSVNIDGLPNPEFMIPQPLTWRSNGEGSSDTYIAVTGAIYDESTGDKLWPNENTPPENLVGGSTAGDGVLKFSVSTSSISYWVPGCYYIYNLVINSNEEMGTIDFGNPTVDTFVDVTATYE